MKINKLEIIKKKKNSKTIVRYTRSDLSTSPYLIVWIMDQQKAISRTTSGAIKYTYIYIYTLYVALEWSQPIEA